MELGQRIKDARLQSGLSQKALCGSTITRNMLSLIESGKAKPSMQTLRYLAEQLGKPISYFLEEDAVLSPNQALMKTAKEAFAAAQFKACLAALDGYTPDGIFDDEAALLKDLSLLQLAEAALADRRHIYAKELLNRMTFAGLYQQQQRKEAQLYLLAKAGEVVDLPSEDEKLYIQAKLHFRLGQDDRANALVLAIEHQNPQTQLLQGQIAVALKEYEAATNSLLLAEAAFPKEAVPLLEQCYRELEDYKMAYTYARKLRGE